MKQSELMNILDDVATGKVTKEEALLVIKEEPFKDMGFAKIDTHRGIRQGVPEVIYGAGKTKEQIKEIVKYLQKSGEETVLITRMSSEAAKFVSEEIDLRYDEISKVGIVGPMPKKDGIGTIVVATAGTSDMYVAEEAALTAEVFGNQVTRLYDVGVAGLHRLISHVDEIMSASVIIAIATLGYFSKNSFMFISSFVMFFIFSVPLISTNTLFSINILFSITFSELYLR